MNNKRAKPQVNRLLGSALCLSLQISYQMPYHLAMKDNPTTPRWSEEQLQQWLSRRGTPSPGKSPPRPAKPSSKQSKGAAAQAGEQLIEAPKKKPRRGIDMAPIIASILKADCRVELSVEGSPSLSMIFYGTRLLSHNELLSVLQYRRYEIYRYKKAWRELVGRAIKQLSAQDWAQVFPGPVKLVLFRRAPKSLDIDSATAIFKYAIDTLVREKVLIDDNRKIVVQIEEHFATGPCASGLRVESCPDWVPSPMLTPEQDWFGD
jgi:hypothetical protein